MRNARTKKTVDVYFKMFTMPAWHTARCARSPHMRASGYRKCARVYFAFVLRFCVSGRESRDGITYSDDVAARIRLARLNRLLMGHAAYPPNHLGTNVVAEKLLRRVFYIRGITLAFSFRSRAFSSNFSLVTDGKQYTFVRDTAIIFPRILFPRWYSLRVLHIS